MNFYEKIIENQMRIPSSFDMTAYQLQELRNSAPGVFDAIAVAFKFGYMQGTRAQKFFDRIAADQEHIEKILH